jgi:hemin uptake protein HemP
MSGSDAHDTNGDDHAATDAQGVTSQTLRTIASSDLLQGAREVLIQHDEKTYRLRVTRNGKLILVK